MNAATQPFKVLIRDRIIHTWLECEQDGKQFQIELKAHSDGLVYWCSHWELIHDLAKMGQVEKSAGGPLGHHDFYLPVKILANI